MDLAFSQNKFHLELMPKDCAGDNCLACVQENNRRAEEARKSLSFELYSFPIWTQLEPFHPFPRVQFQLGPNSKQGWRQELSDGEADSSDEGAEI